MEELDPPSSPLARLTLSSEILMSTQSLTDTNADSHITATMSSTGLTVSSASRQLPMQTQANWRKGTALLVLDDDNCEITGSAGRSTSSGTPLTNQQEGIAAYIYDESMQTPPPVNTPASCLRSQKKKKTRKPPTTPWYCTSRPISEQTKDIKIRAVNRSTSIYYSRLLEKCKSIIEFCIPKDAKEEIDHSNISKMNHNDSWGDSLPSNVRGKTIRVLYQNVNRSVSASDNPETNVLLENLNNMDADVFMASETNTNWKSATFRNDFRQKVSNIWPNSRVAFSSSDVGIEFEFTEYLPGGTCTMAMDHLSMRETKVGEDQSGLGRWSYLTMEGQDRRKVTFITAYQFK